ncbi:MAG: YciI family protein [Actinomycetota bacterium]|nr:YciI family protein [Actinomycetota bacterium]
MNHFLYKLIPPRPTFDRDMSATEQAVMDRHIAYWQGLVGGGTATVFGPVSDPAGAWGLAVVAAETITEVRAVGDADPAVVSGLARFEVCPMPGAIVAQAQAAA